MKILHVSAYFSPSWAFGGIPRVVEGLTSAQVSMGNDVSVVTTDAYNKNQRAPVDFLRQDQHRTIFTLKNCSNQLAYRQCPTPFLSSPIKTQITQSDIVHIHGARNLLIEQVALYASRKNIPFVVTPNGTQRRHQSRLKRKWIWDKIFSATQKARHWIAVSNAERTDLVNEHISAHNISVIPNGVDTKEIDLYMDNNIPQSSTKEKRIGYLGQLSHRKGVQDLIAATLMLKNTPVDLFIAGNDMGSLERLKKQAGHAPNVHFLGLLQGNERLQFLQSLDLLVYPSKDEAFGLVPFEAILCGTPVVVGNDAGCKEWLSLAGCTHFTPFGNPSKLAQIITQQLETKHSLTTIQNWIRKHLSWSSVAQSTAECYTNILEGSP